MKSAKDINTSSFSKDSDCIEETKFLELCMNEGVHLTSGEIVLARYFQSQCRLYVGDMHKDTL